MKVHNWFLTVTLISTLQPSEFAEEFLGSQNLYFQVRSLVFNIVGRTSLGRGLTRATRLNKIQRPVADNVAFPCDTTNGRSSRPPDTVHQLRPGDIDVVAGVGDSLMSANGAAASRLIDVSVENRGLSWAIGGQGNWRQYLTLPNILKEFNPKLVGYSLGDSLSFQTEAQFNVAELGAMSEDTIYMAMELVSRIKADPRVNFERDWKLVTLLIGSNDFCLSFCYLSPKTFNNIAEIHRRELTLTLDYLRDNLPRTLVNLVLAPNLEILHDLKGLPSRCDYLHLVTCPCLFGRIRESSYPQNIAKQREWQKVEREVAMDERYRRKEDFAVVLQSFTGQLVFPEIKTKNGFVADKSFLSEDCFHFSQKAYARAANALWNNMMEPIGNKTENWANIYTRFLCPTKEHPYIFTHGNSFTNQITREADEIFECLSYGSHGNNL